MYNGGDRKRSPFFVALRLDFHGNPDVRKYQFFSSLIKSLCKIKQPQRHRSVSATSMRARTNGWSNVSPSRPLPPWPTPSYWEKTSSSHLCKRTTHSNHKPGPYSRLLLLVLPFYCFSVYYAQLFSKDLRSLMTRSRVGEPLGTQRASFERSSWCSSPKHARCCVFGLMIKRY